MRNLRCLIFAYCIFFVGGHFLITSPRRWTAGTPTPICIVLTSNTFSEGDNLSATLVDREQNRTILEETIIPVPLGESQACIDVEFADSELHSRKAELTLTGTLNAHPIVGGSSNVTLVKPTGRTFIQTDKYLYKPGQTVQFRILTVKGPKLEVSNSSYVEIYVQSPSRTRIYQWLDVQNSPGLVHLNFDLSDEAEEGSYSITVESDADKQTARFKIEEYVLPRYEVTIEGPKVILGSDPNITVTLCAKYTFGQPVKGNASLSIAAGSWKIYSNMTQTAEISGCHNFTYNTSGLLFDHNNCHIRISSLRASGHVNESDTGESLFAAETTLSVDRTGIRFSDLTPSFIKKPHLPYPIKMSAKYADGSPAKHEPVEVCGRRNYADDMTCKNMTTCNKGYLEFVLPNDIQQRVEIKALNYRALERNWNNVMEDSDYNYYASTYEKYVDPTNSSITIFSENDIHCTTGETINVSLPLIYIVKNLTSADVYIQVMSRGQIIVTDKVPITFAPTGLPMPKDKFLLPLKTAPEGTIIGVADLPIRLPSSSSPNIKVMVWIPLDNHNVIADSKEIDVTPCLEQAVNMSWSTEKGQPGSSASLSINAAPNAICSVGVIDKSVDLLSAGQSKIAVSHILDVASNSVVNRWDENQLNLQYCLNKRNLTEPTFNVGTPAVRRKRSFPPIRRQSGDKEPLDMFFNAGLNVITTLNIEHNYCESLIIEALKELRPPEIFDSGILGPFESEAADRPPAALGFAAPQPAPQQFSKLKPSISEDVSSFSGAGATAEPEKERTYFPETWLWDIEIIPNTGLLEKPVTLPDAITEWIGQSVCVHPEKGVGISDSASITTFTPFFIDILLPASVIRGEILPLKMSVFNYEDGPLPVTLTLEPSEDYEILDGAEGGIRSICIPAQDKSVQTIRLRPLNIGKVNVTVSAATDLSSQPECSINAPSQKSDRLVRSLPVDAEGIEREKTFTQYVCGEDVVDSSGPVATWSVTPPAGIVEGSDRAWISATGDLLGPSIENLGNLIRMPTGCGEQNMLNLAPNIFIMEYLETAKETTQELKDKIQLFATRGYQRQLHYRRRDGSYSAFGKRDRDGSTWLTAFVIKSFSKAKNFIYIDDQSLQQTIDWLKGLIDKNGCFLNRGRVINKMMKGGIKGSDSDALLTAYVVTALAESGQDVTNSLPCIVESTSTNNYGRALTAYALGLAGSPEAQVLIDALLGAAKLNESSMRWDLDNNENINGALHVETAAYALLALLTADPVKYAGEARKIVRWISSQRNGRGGFVSTQDTVVALQALAAFEAAQPSAELNLNVKMSAGEVTQDFSLLENNKFLLQAKDLPPLPQDVSVNVQGQGCGLIQATMRYNVPAIDPSVAFTLSVENTEAKSDCKTRNITACTSYQLADGASNMALLQVKLISGYIPIKKDLKETVDYVPSVMRYEIDGSTVTFYLDEVTKENVCVSFKVYREVDVEDIKPGSVTVIDYYDPDIKITQEYTFPTMLC